MSDLINVLKRINKKIESSSDSYIYYDELTGVIKKISNIREINDYSMLRVNHEQVKDIIKGRYKYNDFLNKNEIVSYKNINDLNKKIIYFKKNKKKLKIIARNGYNKAHRIFNNKLISDFIVKKSFNFKTNSKIKWIND